ncbi:hypothetical protein KR054_005839, partial [Drosophila jambulina]
SARRKWQPSEEDCFIEIWKNNLYLFDSRKKLVETYAELQKHFREVGIDISGQVIKSKMESLKRKYFNLLHANRDDKSSSWEHFDTMAAIIAATSRELAKDPDWDDVNSHRKISLLVFLEILSHGPFNSVYVEEGPRSMFKSEDGKRSKKSTGNRKKRQRAKKTPAKQRRFWYAAEEIIFVNVWEQFNSELLSERKKMDVYKDMEQELHGLGLQVTPNDIKSKMESLTRTFRAQRNAVGDKSEWIHYSQLSRLLCHLEPIQFEHFPDTTSSSEDDLPWLSEIQPTVELIDNPTHSSDSVVNQFEDCTQPCPSSPSIDIDYGQSFKVERIEQLERIERPVSDRKTATEEFGQFVTKELAVLNDDLLIEAKRRIYNIICNLQMKQNDLNKLT